MFVHSAHFVERHKHSPGEELSVFGQEKTGETVRLAKMNLAIHGLSGEIREGNSYYDAHAAARAATVKAALRCPAVPKQIAPVL